MKYKAIDKLLPNIAMKMCSNRLLPNIAMKVTGIFVRNYCLFYIQTGRERESM